MSLFEEQFPFCFFDKKSKFFVPKKKKKDNLTKKGDEINQRIPSVWEKSEMFRSFLFFGR